MKIVNDFLEKRENMEVLIRERVLQEKYQIALRLIKMGILSEDDIARATELSVEEIKTLIGMEKSNS